MDDIIKGLIYMFIILVICSVLGKPTTNTIPRQEAKNPFTVPQEVYHFKMPIHCTD